MTTQTFTVSGMTCQHCVNSVTEEISLLEGVSGVDIDLASGSVKVTGDRELELDSVRAAVEEAGYQLV